MSLWQIPEAVSGDKQIIASAVRYKTSAGIDFLEFLTDFLICVFDIVGGNEDAMKRIGGFCHSYQCVYVGTLADSEQNGVWVGKRGVFGAAYDNTPLFEIYLVHLTYNFINFARIVYLAHFLCLQI